MGTSIVTIGRWTWSACELIVWPEQQVYLEIRFAVQPFSITVS